MILNITTNDCANLMCEFNAALNESGIPSKAFKQHRHPFGYDNECERKPDEFIMDQCRDATIVNIFHSDLHCLELFIASGSMAMLNVWHTGTPYRNNPEQMNARFNPLVSMSFCDETELTLLGCKNPQYIAGPVNVSEIKPVYPKLEKPYIFAHYPSNEERKGTKTIRRVFAESGIELKYSPNIVSGKYYWNRMADCDIYVELFNPIWDGREYGNFGVTAFDAAALGKVVITQCLYPAIYEKEYGKMPFILVSTEEELKFTIQKLHNSDPEEISEMQINSRMAMEYNHNYSSAADHYMGIIEEYL